MKKASLFLIAFSLALLILPLSAKAFAVKAKGAVYVAPNETINGNLYAAGNTITIDGNINGDLICAAQSIIVNGKIAGDVICAGQSININGEIGGSVRAAGNTISINAPVARNVQAFGASVILSKNATVGWDVLIADAFTEIRGKINGDLHGATANMNLSGEVNGNVKLKIDSKNKPEKIGSGNSGTDSGFVITDTAVINGNLDYSDSQEANISGNAKINGETNYNKTVKKTDRKNFFVGWAWMRLFSLFSSFVIGLVLTSVWRKQITELTDRMLKKTGLSISWGIAVTFLTPIIVFILLFTVIGIPLALLLLGAWIIALFISKILAAIMAGRYLINRYWKTKKDSLIWAMVLGIIAAWVLFSIPFIGWLFTLLAVWWGMGAIWLALKKA